MRQSMDNHYIVYRGAKDGYPPHPPSSFPKYFELTRPKDPLIIKYHFYGIRLCESRVTSAVIDENLSLKYIWSLWSGWRADNKSQWVAVGQLLK